MMKMICPMTGKLIQFRLEMDSPGDTVVLRFYFSEPVGNKWYKYDLVEGWTEFSQDFPGYVNVNRKNNYVELTLTDGGAGDGDGCKNGVIVDPSGPGGTPSSNSASSSSGSSGASASGGGGGGGCFIATAAFGSALAPHVQVLKDFRDAYLMKNQFGKAFVHAYYRYSPPVARLVENSNALKIIVRTGLMPLTGFSCLLLHGNGWLLVMLTLGVSGCGIIFLIQSRRQSVN